MRFLQNRVAKATGGVVDLSHELPSPRRSVPATDLLDLEHVPHRAHSFTSTLDALPAHRSDLTVVREHVGWTSRMGNAVLFLGRAAASAQKVRIDVDDLAQLLYAEGVPKSSMSTLAVVVHAPFKRDAYGSHAKGGWYRESQSVVLESPADEHSVVFDQTLNLVLSDEDPNILTFSLLHEAAHLKHFVTDQAGDIKYAPQNVARWRKKSYAALGTAVTGAAGMLAGYAEGLPNYVALPAAGLLGAAAVGSALSAKFAHFILWARSGEEKQANAFASEHYRQHRFVQIDPTPPVPANHLAVEYGQLSIIQSVEFDAGRLQVIFPPARDETELLAQTRYGDV